MKENTLLNWRQNLGRTFAIAGVATGLLYANFGGVGFAQTAQTAPANLSPGLQEVVKLTQAKMADDVVVAYIKNSGATYSLSANDILYLNSQGVSQPVISALLQAKPSAPASVSSPTIDPAPPTSSATVTPPVAPPPGADAYPPGAAAAPSPGPGSEVNYDYFHDQLAPYGTWMNMPGYGSVFSPTAAATPGWRPYSDAGHWVYTDDGWFWQSDYPWGEIAFHYGRWLYTVSNGWLWVPGYDYAPAWVCWRHAESEGYCGWAPLPPGAVFRPGLGLYFNGRVALDIDFGLNSTYFTFVPFAHFWDHDFRRYIAPREFVGRFYRRSVIMNNYHVVGGRFVIEGLGHDRIALLTHHDVHVERVAMHDARIEHHAFDRRVVEEHDRGRVIGHGDDRSHGGFRDDHDHH